MNDSTTISAAQGSREASREPGSTANSSAAHHRILIVDDMQGIHDDFRKILSHKDPSRLDEVEAALFDAESTSSIQKQFLFDSAYNGVDGLALVQRAVADKQPYSLAFVDVRMPTGWDGIESAKRIWEADPHLQIVVCSAYSDYSWDKMSRRLGETDSLVFLKKPFDTIEVMQLVHALTTKWSLARQARHRMAELDALVAKRTEELVADIAVRKQAEQKLAAFASLGIRLSAAQTAKAAAEIVVGAADQLLGWDACACYSYLSGEDQVSKILAIDTIHGMRKEGDSGSTERVTGVIYDAIHRGGQLVLHSDSQKPQPPPTFGASNRPPASILCVPIRDGASVIGILYLQSYKNNAYNQHSLETLQALADHCGGALNRIKSDQALNETESQLRQAQKMEAIGQLAGGVAHDFNNLLAVIIGNAEIAMTFDKREPGASVRCLQDIVDAANRGANLTRQLLAFSRKQIVQAQAMDLNKHLANLDKMLKRVIGEDIELVYSYADNLPLVQTDPGMLDQVMMNLVVNSRDAMPTGGRINITTSIVTFDASSVHAHPEGRLGKFVGMSVSDTGTGIKPDDLPRVFEPFFTTKAVGKGTGLGLATVFGIVKQHGGWVEVTSSVGVGTTFRIYIPALEVKASSSTSSIQKSDTQGGHEVILLVEDEDAVRMVTRRVLEQAGYRVIESSCGQNAIDLWEKHSHEIELLLTDVVMPGGVNGRDLAVCLIGRKPNLKVIFVSGYTHDIMAGDTTILKRLNTRFINKPCKRDDLLRIIREQLDSPAKDQNLEVVQTTKRFTG